MKLWQVLTIQFLHTQVKHNFTQIWLTAHFLLWRSVKYIIDSWPNGLYVLLSWGTRLHGTRMTTCLTGKSAPHDRQRQLGMLSSQKTEMWFILIFFLSFSILTAGCPKPFHFVTLKMHWINSYTPTAQPHQTPSRGGYAEWTEKVSGSGRPLSILHSGVKGGLPILRVAERLKLWANLMSTYMWLQFFCYVLLQQCNLSHSSCCLQWNHSVTDLMHH